MEYNRIQILEGTKDEVLQQYQDACKENTWRIIETNFAAVLNKKGEIEYHHSWTIGVSQSN